MLIDASHWAVALLVAVSVHIAGIMWFEPARHALPMDQELGSERIVVRLGTGSGHASAVTSLLGSPKPSPLVPPSATIMDERQSAVPQPKVEDVEKAVQDVVAPRTGRRAIELEATEAPESKDVAVLRADSEVSDVDKVIAATTLLLPAEESSEAREAVVLAPTADSKEEVSSRGPVPLQFEAQEREVPEPVAAPTELEHLNIAPIPMQDTINQELPVKDEVKSVPTEAQLSAASKPEQQVTTTALARETPSLESVEEVGATAVSAAVTLQTAASTSVEPQEQIARAITLEELHDISGVSARYAGLLKGWLRENMHYPRAARLAGQEGRAIVRFVIDRSGKVISIQLEQSSGFAILDREAVEMIERADPFPIMPVEMGGTKLELRVPVVFEINQGSLTRQIPPIFLE